MKLFISTGDVSGDFHAALLVQTLKKRDPSIVFFGVGAEKLKGAGVEIVENSAGWSAVGVFDALPKVPKIYAAYRRVKKKLQEIKPDGLILIDTPAFNVPLSRYARAHEIPSLYFFPPSAWKQDFKRAAKVGNSVEKVIAPFPETAELYGKAGVPTFFSGHPLVDLIPANPPTNGISRKEMFQMLELDPQKPVIGLFPGSRKQEIRYLLPIMFETVQTLLREKLEIQFVLSVATKELEPAILSLLKKSNLPITARREMNQACMQVSNLLLVASGTATLEAALHEKPMVIIYKVSPWSWKLQKPFLKGVKFAGLPNLLANEPIVPELIQENASVENIVGEIKLLFEPNRTQKMIDSLRAIRNKLGKPGVMERVADVVLEMFRKQDG